MNEYQLLPPLRPEQREALKRDIAERGVLVPVEIDETGAVLDGHHRVEIATELGLDYKVIERKFATEQEKRHHVRAVNLLRRHLDPITRTELYLAAAKDGGVQLGRGGDRRSTDTVSVGRADDLARNLGIEPRTARRWVRDYRDLAPHPDLLDAVRSGKTDVNRALRVARERELKTRTLAAGEAMALPPTARIERCDFRDLKLEPGSVDLIFTDPPYLTDHLPLWKPLGEFATRVLKPGRLLVNYIAEVHLPRIMDDLREAGLSFVCAGSVWLGGPTSRLHSSGIHVRAKTLLMFSNGPYERRREFNNAVAEPGPEKGLHIWQQGVKAGEYFIGCITEPGELVCDPFLGSGTFGVAALKLGRSFVGCEIDAATFEIARARISVEGKPDEEAAS